MKNVTIRRGLFAVILIIVMVVGYIRTDAFDPDPSSVKQHYYEVIEVTEELYGNHHYDKGIFYNEKFRKEEDVEQYLSSYMTENAIEKVIDNLFQSKQNLLIYNSKLQDYLFGKRNTNRSANKNTDFYTVVKNSLINPGLKLIYDEDINVFKEEGRYIAEADLEEIQFYDEDYGNYHFNRLGYPMRDYLTIHFVFIEEDGNLLLDDYRVQSRQTST